MNRSGDRESGRIASPAKEPAAGGTREQAAEKSAEQAAEQLRRVERQLASPESPESIEAAVESLEQACRQWPALMACVTDRAVWESLARQVRRLERLAAAGGETLRTMEVLSGSARGYTERGEPAKAAVRPANVDCRG